MTLSPFCFTQAVQFPVCRVLNYQVLHYFVEQLSRRPETVKLLILVSDGQPADTGYYGTAAEEDLRGIKQEYTRKKILFAAAAIGDDKLSIERIYGDSFLDITDLNQLPVKLTALVKRHIRVIWGRQLFAGAPLASF